VHALRLQWQARANKDKDPSLKELLAAYDVEVQEQRSNMVSLSKAAGRMVECGDVIQLMHVRSKLFLTMLKSRALMEQSAMRLELTADG
jgi:hypothetical protein